MSAIPQWRAGQSELQRTIFEREGEQKPEQQKQVMFQLSPLPFSSTTPAGLLTFL